MKGFIHILEIIIVALTMFVVIALFTYIPRIEADWSRTRLTFYGNDLFFSLEEEGINWLDTTQVNESLERILPGNLEIDLRVKNAIMPRISLGCVCPEETAQELEDMLNGFEFNGVNISFRLERINASRISFPITLDLMLFFNQNIPDNKRQELELYLEYGRGVLEVSGLDTNMIASPIYREIFGLEWVDESLPLTGYDAGFYETEPGKNNYNIMKYFQHLPFRAGLSQALPPEGVTSCTGRYASGPFAFRDSSYTLWAIDNSSSGCGLSLYIDKNNNNILEPQEGPFGEGETITLDNCIFRAKSIEWNHTDILFQESEYEFSFSGLRETVYPRDNASEKIILHRDNALYPDGRSVPVSVINYNVINGKGRTAWLSNSTAQGLESDIEQLLKSLVVWTAGEEYQIIRGLEKTDPITLYFYKTLDQDMFQPIELALTLGYRQ